MKKVFNSLTIILVLFLIFGGDTVAQNHHYTVTTWKVYVPEGGSMTEFNSLLQEYYDKVVSKNEFIISEKVMRHLSGSDMHDWVFITEYASWNDIDAASERQDELFEEGWPDEKSRQEFNKKFFSYAKTHSDEILVEQAKLRK